jgi:hypothetical protein
VALVIRLKRERTEGQAEAAAAFSRYSNSSSRMRNFWIFPVTVAVDQRRAGIVPRFCLLKGFASAEARHRF